MNNDHSLPEMPGDKNNSNLAISMDNSEHQISQLVEQLAATLIHRGWTFACAESCTGGMLSKSCTDLAGSSQWFECAYVTYSNEAKSAMLDVPRELLEACGAVSEEVAQAMVKGALHKAVVDLAVSITGIAGPGGGTAEKPVGSVCFAFAVKGAEVESVTMHFSGDRQHIRQQSVVFALDNLLKIIGSGVENKKI